MIDLQLRDAILLVALWRHKDADDRVFKASARRIANREVAKDGLPEYSLVEVRQCTRRLASLGCIETCKHDASRWHLKETLTFEFTPSEV